VRILALDQFSDPGGAQRVLLDALAAFGSRGWSARVGLAGNGPMFAAVEGLGFAAEPLNCGPYRSGAKSARDLLRFAVEVPRLAAQIRRSARRFGAGLVYINGPRLLPAAALAGLRVPVVFHSHSYLPPGRMRDLAGLALRHLRADTVANCRFTSAQWARFVPPTRRDVIYNGVDGPHQACEREPGPPRIGCIGRIAPEKGQLAFVEAARRIHRALPVSRFLIAGAPLFDDAPSVAYDTEVRRAAAELPLEFTGWSRDVYALLSRLDLLLVPSAPHEATTRVIPEAWAARVPVIAFPSGGIREIVRHRENGFLAGTPTEAADLAVRLLAGDRAEMARIAEGGHAAWQRGFTRERFAERLLHVLSRPLTAASTTIAHPSRQGEAWP
jgi:glycosyltransferase involved in cell wall biosynthesis